MYTMEECFICFIETDEFVLFECSHKVCSTCFPKLRSNKCPMCNEPIVILHPPSHIRYIGMIVMVGAIVATILWCKREVF